MCEYVFTLFVKHQQVDHQYVKKKILLLLFPFTQKDWYRGVKEGKVAPPTEDKLAYDLYIPLMALITYILTMGYILGATGKFTPDELGIMFSSTFGFLVFEFLVTKAAAFVLAVSSPIYELIALITYKYVRCVVCLCTCTMCEVQEVYMLERG
eukprot:m.45943 g.45943  ORF g.45943 m.45943 type:complete len:153 (-) comp10702_c0_seq8:253-711(-)